MSGTEGDRAEGRLWLSWIVLLVLMGVALALRWRYICEISLSVDEFNTIWAARNVLTRGLPSFPSGNIYPHGFVFTYLVVPTVLGKFSEALVRVPGLIVGLAGVPVTYWVGRRFFSDRVGFFAAAAMAVDPDCILWGARARMYGLLQLLTLLVIFFYYRGLVRDRARDRYLAMALSIVAIFTHLEAALLLPALGLATLLVWPWRRILRWSVIFPFILAGVGAGVFFLISKFGQPGHLETLQESRPYLELSTDVLSSPQVFAPVFTDVHRLPFTLLALVGIVFVFRPRLDRRAPLPYLYVILVAVLVPLLALAGPTWQNERYLFFLLPVLFLIGGQALVALLDLLPALRKTLPWQPATLALLVALYVGLTGAPSAYAQELGYDLAFRYLHDQWTPEVGDRVVTTSPTACVLYLGQCDRFAIQHGYEEFIVSRPGDGLDADLWTATPVLTETAEFVDLLATAPRVWFVSDRWRLQTRYDGDFIQTVLEHMDLVYDERGVLVFRGEGYTSPHPPPVQLERRTEFDNQLALVGFGLSSANPKPGNELEVTLFWRALGNAGVAYTAFLHLLAPDGAGVAGIDEPVLRGLYQPDLWPEDMVFADRHRLMVPPELPPGRYRLDLGLYPTDQPDSLLPVGAGDRLPLASLTVGEIVISPPTSPVNVTFGEQIRLLGFDLACDAVPMSCNLQLQWQAVGAVDRDYTTFVHLVGPDNVIVTQDDAPPGGAFFPTSTWLTGDVVLAAHRLDVPAGALPGEYALVVGLYHQPSGDRLQARDAEGQPLGDAVMLVTSPPGLKSP